MSHIPPLLGDGHGKYRVHLIGNSGKYYSSLPSTLGAELAAMLKVPYVPLDPLFWNPGWTASTPEEFRAKVLKRLTENERGWVVDGNYEKALQGLVKERRTDIVWLDPPFLLYFPRLLMRTFWRLIRRADGCAPGCVEGPVDVFLSKENSIIYWAVTQHRPVRRREAENLKNWAIEVGGIMRRIGGWGGELRAWKQAVAEMVREQ
ncbi:hypothetical protein HYDPIDRAFT_130633 [Hydnomerulius pinastri MD-312]|nr:hypothetical protein HYDPIDRAFT_130633 [Hydnomerulius pinastri MD-312]